MNHRGHALQKDAYGRVCLGARVRNQAHCLSAISKKDTGHPGVLIVFDT